MHTLWLVTCVSSPFSRGLQQGNRIRPTLPLPVSRLLQPSSNGYWNPPEEGSGEDRRSIREGLNRPGQCHCTHSSCHCNISSEPHRHCGLIVFIRSSNNKSSMFTRSIDEMTSSYFPFSYWCTRTRRTFPCMLGHEYCPLDCQTPRTFDSSLGARTFEIILITPGE